MSGIDVNELRAQQLDFVTAIQSIENQAISEERDISDDEETAINDLMIKAQAVAKRVERLETLNALSQSAGRKTTEGGSAATFKAGAKIGTATPAFAKDTGKWGFENLGDYYRSVIRSSRRNAEKDARLIANAATTYSGEADLESGGFAVPPDFRPEIIRLIGGEASLLPRTDQLTTSTNSMSFPVDDSAPWSTGGVQVYWESEAGTKTASKIKGEPKTLRLGKLIALCPIVDELLEDVPGLQSYVTAGIARQMNWEINKALVNGDGVGKMLGVLNASSLVSTAKESGQAADTIVPQNIWNMWVHLYSECRQNAIWLVNPDVEAQLLGLALTSNNSLVPMYMPPGGISASPYGTLLGRPVISTQVCSTLGDAGDIILVDFSKYLTITKVSGPKNDISIHFYFDQDVTTMRSVLRINGAPWWKTYLTPRVGTNYLSWAVTLEERAT